MPRTDRGVDARTAAALPCAVPATVERFTSMTPQAHKIAFPVTEGQIQRLRCIDGLRRSLRQAPLVWMVGLPGAGKTSLAAQALRQAEQAGEPALWYRLDEDDGDVAGVFDALGRAAPEERRAALPAWSPDNQPELRGFARRFFGQLVGAGRLNIAFDDCHRVAEDSPFFEMLDAAREACGDGLRLLLISRRAPPPLLARGQLAGWLDIYDDLRLEPDEAAALAERVAGRKLSAAQTRRLGRAEGWIAHIMAMAQSADLDEAPPPPPGAAAIVGDYLANELLLMFPAAQRRPFRLLAELPEIPLALAESGRLPPSARRLLDDLARRRYFVEATAARTWRMHDLLRDGLRAINDECESAAALASARVELAGWIAAGAPEAAMNLLVAAGDCGGAGALLERQGRAWLEQGRHRQVLGWLDALDACLGGDGAAAALLTLWKAEALLPLEPEHARPLFARGRERCAALGDAASACRAWCGEVASYVVQWGAVQGLAELVDALEALVAELGPPPGDWAFRTAADALTALMYGRPEDPRLAQYAKATARALDFAPDAGSRIAAAAQLLIYRLWWAGDFPGGKALYNAFSAEVERGEVPPLARLIWWSNAAILDWQCGDPAECYRKVDQGLLLAEQCGVHVRDFFLLTQGIFCALSQEDWTRAEGYLDRLARTERGHKRLDVMVHHFFRSWYCLSRGDAPTALAHAETALPMAEALGSGFHMVIVLSALAPARLHAGDFAGAEWAYRKQLELAKAANNPTFSFIAFCAGAEIALARGDGAALRKQLERMLMVKQLGGFHSTCGWRTPVMAELLAHALEHDIFPPTAQRWIREKRVAPPRPVAGWPLPVQIAALCGLEVRIDEGGEETAPQKPPAKLRELLAILVAERGGVAQAELGEWLWPEADGDRAAASLKVSIHRLRQWLGTEAVTVRNQRVGLNPARVGCDLWQMLDRMPALDPERILAGFDSPPVLALRQRLRRTTSRPGTAKSVTALT